MTTERLSAKDLLERSSLGTPAAKQLRARTPTRVVRAILDRSRRPLEAAAMVSMGSCLPEEAAELDGSEHSGARNHLFKRTVRSLRAFGEDQARPALGLDEGYLYLVEGMAVRAREATIATLGRSEPRVHRDWYFTRHVRLEPGVGKTSAVMAQWLARGSFGTWSWQAFIEEALCDASVERPSFHGSWHQTIAGDAGERQSWWVNLLRQGPTRARRAIFDDALTTAVDVVAAMGREHSSEQDQPPEALHSWAFPPTAPLAVLWCAEAECLDAGPHSTMPWMGDPVAELERRAAALAAKVRHRCPVRHRYEALGATNPGAAERGALDGMALPLWAPWLPGSSQQWGPRDNLFHIEPDVDAERDVSTDVVAEMLHEARAAGKVLDGYGESRTRRSGPPEAPMSPLTIPQEVAPQGGFPEHETGALLLFGIGLVPAEPV